MNFNIDDAATNINDDIYNSCSTEIKPSESVKFDLEVKDNTEDTCRKSSSRRSKNKRVSIQDGSIDDTKDPDSYSKTEPKSEDKEFEDKMRSITIKYQNKIHDDDDDSYSLKSEDVDFELISKINIFDFTLDGLFNHKLRRIIRCDTEEIDHDLEHPYVYQGMTIGERLRGVKYDKNVNRWFHEAAYSNKFKKFNELEEEEEEKEDGYVSHGTSMKVSNKLSLCQLKRYNSSETGKYRRSKNYSRISRTSERVSKVIEPVFSQHSSSSDKFASIDTSNFSIEDIDMTLAQDVRDYLETRFDNQTVYNMLIKENHNAWLRLFDMKIDFLTLPGVHVLEEQVCVTNSLFDKFIDSNTDTLNQLKKSYGVITQAVFLCLMFFTRGEMEWSQFKQILGGKGDLKAVRVVKNFHSSEPQQIGFLRSASNNTMFQLDMNLSFICCKLIHDLSLLKNGPNKLCLFVLNYHFHQLNRILESTDHNITHVFVTLKIASRFSKIIHNTFEKSEVTSLLFDLTGIHQLIFEKQCCDHQNLTQSPPHIVFCTMRFSASTELFKLFRKFDRSDRRFRKIERACNCLINCRVEKSIVRDQFEEPVLDIYYDLLSGSHFGAIEMILDLLHSIVSKFTHSSTKVVVCYPTGELWVFNEVEWLKEIVNKKKLGVVSSKSQDEDDRSRKLESSGETTTS